jgi:hypothetical protein
VKSEVLHSLLMDVRERGSASVEKRKLMWMLGRTYEGANAWSALLDEWKEVGGSKDTLYGVECGPFITLTNGRPANIKGEWAT